MIKVMHSNRQAKTTTMVVFFARQVWEPTNVTVLESNNNAREMSQGDSQVISFLSFVLEMNDIAHDIDNHKMTHDKCHRCVLS